jgi:hypothetical protein
VTFFVVQYDRRAGKGVWLEFEEAELALNALREKEAAREPHVEVVLFMADSLDQLRETHSRFFMDAEEIGARLARDTLARSA